MHFPAHARLGGSLIPASSESNLGPILVCARRAIFRSALPDPRTSSRVCRFAGVHGVQVGVCTACGLGCTHCAVSHQKRTICLRRGWGLTALDRAGSPWDAERIQTRQTRSSKEIALFAFVEKFGIFPGTGVCEWTEWTAPGAWWHGICFRERVRARRRDGRGGGTKPAT